MDGIIEPIYKISHINRNRIQTIYVFCGKNYQQQPVAALDLLFVKNPTATIFADIFTPAELEEITENALAVQFIPDRLHLDDTLEIIKKKLLAHLNEKENKAVAFDEVYFFMRQAENFQAFALFQNLTQNEKLDLTRERLVQFLLNIDDIDVTTVPEKPLYTFEDILRLNLEQSTMMVSKPLGQKFTSVNHDYPYTVNPYDVETYDPFLEKFASEMLATANQSLLMQHGKFYTNTIYLCLAPEVLAHATENDLAESSTLKIYFPYLTAKNITSAEELQDQKQTLVSDTLAMVSSAAFKKNCENINLFYDIYANRKEDMKFSDMGIKSINLTVHQPTSFNLPLDIVFKLIHATQDIPLIKMNLSKRRENIYRLYVDKIATNGKKIPYLEKGKIFKWDKEMGKNKSVAVYIEYYEEETNAITPVICEFSNTGAINIKANFNKSIKADAVNELFIKYVNPVINIVKEYLAQGGYSMINFVAMNDPTVEILNIDFTMNLAITKKMNIKTMAGCLTSIFNIVNSDLAQGIMLRFKRVANYNEMESQEALIIDMTQPHLNYSDSDIIKVIQANFHLTEAEAQAKYIEVKREQELMQSGNKRMKMRNNPGFFTAITQQAHSNIIMINVSGINDIKYLDVVYIYLDSLLRLTQNPGSTEVSASEIGKLCKGAKAQVEPAVSEIEAAATTTDGEMTIVGEELVFNAVGTAAALSEAAAAEEEEIDIDEEDLFARFGVANDDEEEEEAEEGGASKAVTSASKAVTETTKKIAQAKPKKNTSKAAESEASGDDDDNDEEELETDVTGLNLSNPSPFESRMVKRDKHLFISDTGKKNMKSYATTCAWNRLRHPVILTDDEKARIDAEHPGSYSQAVKYGSQPDKKFWYICPRYWSLKDNTSLREDEVNKAEVIPAKSDKGKYVVPKGKHIFEFNDYGIEHMDMDKSYKTHYPGFLKPNENGVCLPCCFSSWDKDEQVKRRAMCTNDTSIVVPEGRKKKKNEEDIDEYILSHDKFPITQENRFGYLPLAIQKFLHTDNKKCQISDLNTNIKPNHVCLLRHSVEIHQTQSFVGCLADLWKGVAKTEGRQTIKQMKEILIAAMDVDLFITLQNGNLVKQFYTSAADTTSGAGPSAAGPSAALEDESADLETYATVFSQSKSKIYENADKTKPAQVNALVKIARAYNNFIAYLRDDTVEIDAEYLWDLICKPNPKLFPNGINMVILELSRKDVTDNVEILCPSNHYSTTFFDVKKRSFILLKIDNFYEPIYSYESRKDEINIQRYFSVMNNELLPNIKHTLTLINRVLLAKCAPRPSMPVAVYPMEKNISLERLLSILTSTAPFSDYTVANHVQNYNSKIIGVVLINNADNSKGFIPCYPSAPLRSTPTEIVWMDHVYTDTYTNTRDFLEMVYKKSRREIPCKPYLKVLEDGLIVGILTKTNQFVLISEPVQDTFGDDLIRTTNGSNYAEADRQIMTSENVDTNRVNFIKKIQLETNFYNVFRNTARYLLGQYTNNELRHEIEEKSNSSQLYLKKLRSVETLLRELMRDHVEFSAYAEEDLLKLDTITSCYNNCGEKPFCKPNENADGGGGGCVLLVPETNLISQKSNDTFYYGKLADEIIRYSRIKTFIFNPKTVLSFANLKYNLRENEIILLQSLLTQEYFENITVAKSNQYVNFNTFDTTQPIKAQNYSNTDTLENIEAYDKTQSHLAEKAAAAKEAKLKAQLAPAAPAADKCNIFIKNSITSKYFADIFPFDSKEYEYQNNNSTCYFKAILTVIKDHNEAAKDLTTNQLKEILAEQYRDLYEKYKPKLLNILRAQGKKEMAALVDSGKLKFYDMLISDNYYPTNIDLWLLAIHYNIPLVFLSDTSLMENNKKLMVAHSDGGDAYYFLKGTAVSTHTNNPLLYTLILDENNNAKIDINDLQDESIQEEIRTAETTDSLLKFIVNFVAPKVAITIRRKLVKEGLVPATAAAQVQAEAPAPIKVRVTKKVPMQVQVQAPAVTAVTAETAETAAPVQVPTAAQAPTAGETAAAQVPTAGETVAAGETAATPLPIKKTVIKINRKIKIG